MIADVREAFQAALAGMLGREVEISEPVLVAGGASKEAWAVDADGEPLLVRRAAVGVIHLCWSVAVLGLVLALPRRHRHDRSSQETA